MPSLLIGIDEAGYGPNLGPLVISGSVWRVADGVRAEDLYELLALAVSSPPLRRDDPRVPIGDSKQLYQGSRGLARLELGVLSALGACGRCDTANPTQADSTGEVPIPDTWRAIWNQLDAQAWPQMTDLPWYRDYDAPLPLQVEPEAITACQNLLRRHTTEPPVQLMTIRSRVIFPRRFNQLVDQTGNKSTTLSQVSLGLVAQLLDDFPSVPAHVLCDKHGGRNRYAHLIQEALDGSLVQVRHEGREESSYRLNGPARRVELRFRAKADRCLPAALASMTSKYLRELAMQAFNAFWCEQIPTLQPTAGYPVDARRFLERSTAARQRLDIDLEAFWRER